MEGNPSFDKNGGDFDILTAAVLAVLGNDENSPVKVLLDGETTLTAFNPTDAAFERTAGDLEITAKTEENLTGKLVDALGVSTIEEILLYHVVPGVKINAKAAVEAVIVTDINKGNKQIAHAINRVLLPTLSA